MRTAVITDIHGNYGGLRTVLADVESQACDRIICLGDLLEGGGENLEVVRWVRDNNVPCVIGNHDEYNSLLLPPDLQAFLKALPEDIVEGDVIYTHVSPRPKRTKISNAVEAWNVFDEAAYRLSFVGHTHYPLIFGEQCAEPVSSTSYAFEYGVPFPLDRADRYVVVVGPAGYGRDGFEQLRYAIYDTQDETVEMRAVEGPLLAIDYANIGLD